LTNDEIIDVDQDPLGKPGHRVKKDGSLEIWARPLSDGSLAVGLFNRGEGFRAVALDWKDLGLTGPQTVRDLWRQTDVGVFDGAFEGFVARHGVLMVRLAPAK
jgi:alpha-galactosidase